MLTRQISVFALSLYLYLLVRGRRIGIRRFQAFLMTSARSVAQSRPNIWSVWLIILVYTCHVSCEQWIPFFSFWPHIYGRKSFSFLKLRRGDMQLSRKNCGDAYLQE